MKFYRTRTAKYRRDAYGKSRESSCASISRTWGACCAPPRTQRRSLWDLYATCDEVHGFGREAVECGDALFEVFFFCVFDFVVADATQRLDEHHHGGNAGARDFGSVMERARRHAMRLWRAGNFCDRGVA